VELMKRDAIRRGEEEKASEQQLQEIDKETITGLQKEWGDKFDHNVQRVRFAIGEVGKAIGVPDLAKQLEEEGLGNNGLLIKAFEHVSKFYNEDDLKAGGVSTSGAMSKEEIQSEINSIFANPVYGDSNHAQHKDVVARFAKLQQMLTGGK